MDKYLRNKLRQRICGAARRTQSAVAKLRTAATALAIVLVAGTASHAAKATLPTVSNTNSQYLVGKYILINNNDPFKMEDSFGLGESEKHITCYPNPATSYINFKFDETAPKDAKLFVFSFTGRKMAELSITGPLLKLTLDNYYRGLYVYQLRSASGAILESGKFQVKH